MHARTLDSMHRTSPLLVNPDPIRRLVSPTLVPPLAEGRCCSLGRVEPLRGRDGALLATYRVDLFAVISSFGDVKLLAREPVIRIFIDLWGIWERETARNARDTKRCVGCLEQSVSS